MKPIELPTLAPAAEPALAPDQIERLQDEVRALAEERNAVILAHNYQLPEIQDVAHFLGDSLGLSRQALYRRLERYGIGTGDGHGG